MANHPPGVKNLRLKEGRKADLKYCRGSCLCRHKTACSIVCTDKNPKADSILPSVSFKMRKRLDCVTFHLSI